MGGEWWGKDGYQTDTWQATILRSQRSSVANRLGGGMATKKVRQHPKTDASGAWELDSEVELSRWNEIRPPDRSPQPTFLSCRPRDSCSASVHGLRGCDPLVSIRRPRCRMGRCARRYPIRAIFAPTASGVPRATPRSRAATVLFAGRSDRAFNRGRCSASCAPQRPVCLTPTIACTGRCGRSLPDRGRLRQRISMANADRIWDCSSSLCS